MVGGRVRLSSWLIDCDVWSCCGPVADQNVVVGPVERPASLIFNAGYGWASHHARDFHVEGGRVLTVHGLLCWVVGGLRRPSVTIVGHGEPLYHAAR